MRKIGCLDEARAIVVRVVETGVEIAWSHGSVVIPTLDQEWSEMASLRIAMQAAAITGREVGRDPTLPVPEKKYRARYSCSECRGNSPGWDMECPTCSWAGRDDPYEEREVLASSDEEAINLACGREGLFLESLYEGSRKVEIR